MRKMPYLFIIIYYVLFSLWVGYTNTVAAQSISPFISAEILLKTASGRSVVQEDVPITSENIKDFTPTPQTIQKAAQIFQSLGFNVPLIDTTLTIMGKPAQFEEVFNIQLDLQFDKTSGSVIAHPSREPTIPDSLKEFVEAVVFPKPVTPMR